jgi:hypothetical protein
MISSISLNNEVFHLTEENLPCLITYREKAGGSQFSITLVADLFLRGSKILFLTAFPMAKDIFLNQIEGMESKAAYVESKDDLERVKDSQAIILQSGNGQLLLDAKDVLDDFEERVIFVKNVEMFDEAIVDSCLSLKKIILSGNYDEFKNKEKISNKIFVTTIVFSEPSTLFPFKSPALAQHQGYLWTQGKEGFVALKTGKLMNAKVHLGSHCFNLPFISN